MQELILNGQTLAKVEIDTQIATAKMYPRQSIENFLKESITMATLDEETAESCIYSLPRSSTNKETGQKVNTFIKGESIRLAEIIYTAWGNLICGARVIANDGKALTIEGLAWDLEKNVKISKTVQQNITYRNGDTYNADMQKIAANAGISIALRNAVLAIVPRALTKKVYDAAVNFAIGDQKKLIAKVEALFARFQKMGIEREKILSYFEKKNASEFTTEDVEEMIGIGTAIKEKSLLIENAFIIQPDGGIAKTLEQDKKLERKPANNISQGHQDFVKEMDQTKPL